MVGVLCNLNFKKQKHVAPFGVLLALTSSDTCQYCSINNLYIDYQGRRKGVQELLSATYFGLHYQLFFVIIKVAK